MVKKTRRPKPAAALTPVAAQGAYATPPGMTATAQVLPAEVAPDHWIMGILALMMFLTPAMRVPYEEMLQDTLKSALVSFATLSTGLLFFWQQRHRREASRWHALMWLPLSVKNPLEGTSRSAKRDSKKSTGTRT